MIDGRALPALLIAGIAVSGMGAAISLTGTLSDSRILAPSLCRFTIHRTVVIEIRRPALLLELVQM